MTDAPAPTRAILYLRLSDARNENGSFADREAKLREKAARLGWQVLRVEIENDAVPGMRRNASAFKRRKITLPDGSTAMRVVRPGFRRILDDLAADRADAILAEDLDRAMRDPRDAQDLIDVIRERKLNADSLSGSLKLTDGGTDAEIMMTEVMVSMARKSSADTSRRVRAMKASQAAKGVFRGGSRAYGYTVDGMTIVECEATEIHKMAKAVLDGVPLRSIARDLRERGVKTSTGGQWGAGSVRQVLLNRRYAGRQTVHGEDGGPAPWPPILTEDVWRAVRARLTDADAVVTWTNPRTGKVQTAKRRSSSGPGPAPRHLGSGLYRCVCGEPMKVQGGRYRCRDGRDGRKHVTRVAEQLDRHVAQSIIDKLSDRDFFDVLVKAAKPEIDVDALRAEVKALQAKKVTLAEMFEADEMDRSEYGAARKRNQEKLDAIESQLTEALSTSRVSRLVSPFNVDRQDFSTAVEWVKLSLGEQRAIVQELATVTVLPTTHRGPGFEESHVKIEWK